MKILNIDNNAKTVKGQKMGYMTGILYLAPANLSGYEVCPMRSEGCTKACLNTAGYGQLDVTQKYRIRKTKMFMKQRSKFMLLLEKDIEGLIRKAIRAHKIPVVRLNGTSDIPWEKVSFVSKTGMKFKNIMNRFPQIQFYDYTKRHNRKELPKNYHLTFSLSENNDRQAKLALKNKMNVAVVFSGKAPERFWHRWVVDGDENDLRFLDKKVRIIALKAKGKAKKDETGFVRKVRKNGKQ